MKIVLASNNEHKLRELRAILSDLGMDVVPMRELDIHIEPDENGTSFEENSYIKAKAILDVCHMPTIADDSGLMVDALNGAPGVYSARYAGENAADADRIQKLLSQMQDVPEHARGAKFVSSICCVFPDGTTITAEGECPGKIAFAPAGDGGFGYDPVFLCGEKTYAEMTDAEKDAVSHRGKALRRFSVALRAWKSAQENNKQ